MSISRFQVDFTIIDDVPTNLTTGIMDVRWQGKDPNAQIVFPTLEVDENFAEIFQMKMAAGRTFLGDVKSDSSSIIVNEKMAGIMEIDAETAIGKLVTIEKRQGTIIGVVKNFNFKPSKQAVEALTEFSTFVLEGRSTSTIGGLDPSSRTLFGLNLLFFITFYNNNSPNNHHS